MILNVDLPTKGKNVVHNVKNMLKNENRHIQVFCQAPHLPFDETSKNQLKTFIFRLQFHK